MHMTNLQQDQRLVEQVIGFAILAVLILACLKITAPFIGPLIWGIIISVSTWPLFLRLRTALGGRRKLAATLMTLIMASFLVLPIVLLFISLSESVTAVAALLKDLTSLKLPEPPDWLIGIPLLGARLEAFWREAMVNLPAALEQIRPLINQAATWALRQTADLGLALLQFLLAVIIAGILYASGESGAVLIRRFALRTGGERGVGLIDVAERTIRSVAQGVIGTAVLQGLLAWFGFAIAGVPGAVLLAFLTFLLGVLQMPTLLLWLPVALWLGYRDQLGWAIFTAIWGAFVVNTVDNIVKPYLISQGAQLPLLLIFAGVLGGLLAWGFIGIFLGATLLAVGYTLFRSWLEEDRAAV
jgi:predicted PurR-regulated permease PerM